MRTMIMKKLRTFALMKRIILILLCCMPAILWAQNNGRQTHTVKTGDTMYSIAKAYGVSIEALEHANPKVVDAHIVPGQVLAIPMPHAGIVPVTEVGNGYTVANQTLRIGVLLPMQDNSDYAKRYIEFYRGLLMACDSVRREGANLEVYGWNSGTTADTMQVITQLPELAEMDIIFGPAEAAQIPVLARFCRGRNIRLVLPFSNNFNLNDFPTVYAATATQTVVTQSAADLIMRVKQNRNYILVKSNMPDARGAAFSDAMAKAAREYGTKLHIVNIGADNTAWASVMNQYQENCIILDNTGVDALGNLFNKLDAFKREHPNYTISLQGYSEWQGYVSKYKAKMHEYDTYTFCTYYRFSEAPLVQRIEGLYQQYFKTPMRKVLPEMGLMGFDLGYYFIHGISALGSSFDVRQSEMHYEPLQHSYYFERVGTGDGFANRAIQLIHYNPNNALERITP